MSGRYEDRDRRRDDRDRDVRSRDDDRAGGGRCACGYSHPAASADLHRVQQGLLRCTMVAWSVL